MNKILPQISPGIYKNNPTPSMFVRINKSSIINLKYVKQFADINGPVAIMTGDHIFKVSKKRMKALEMDYKMYHNTIASI